MLIVLCLLLLACYWIRYEWFYVYRIFQLREKELLQRCEGNATSFRLTTQQYNEKLLALQKQCARPELGLLQLAPAVSHTILQESCSIFLGPAPLVAQLADPTVAHSVNRHWVSQNGINKPMHNYVIRRAQRTKDMGDRLTFGTLEQVMETSRQLWAIHEKIQGVVQACPYSAQDHDRLQWVWATLVDASFLAHELFVLDSDASWAEEKEQHYSYFVKTAIIFGLDPDKLPQSLEAFKQYYRFTVWRIAQRITASPPPSSEQPIFSYLFPVRLVKCALIWVPLPICRVLETQRPPLYVALCIFALLRTIYRLIPKKWRRVGPYTQWIRRRDQQLKML